MVGIVQPDDGAQPGDAHQRGEDVVHDEGADVGYRRLRGMALADAPVRLGDAPEATIDARYLFGAPGGDLAVDPGDLEQSTESDPVRVGVEDGEGEASAPREQAAPVAERIIAAWLAATSSLPSGVKAFTSSVGTSSRQCQTLRTCR